MKLNLLIVVRNNLYYVLRAINIYLDSVAGTDCSSCFSRSRVRFSIHPLYFTTFFFHPPPATGKCHNHRRVPVSASKLLTDFLVFVWKISIFWRQISLPLQIHPNPWVTTLPATSTHQMEPSSSSPSPKKLKFVPKVPPRRRSERISRTVQRDNDKDEAAVTERLKEMLRLQERTSGQRHTSETRSPVRIAFGGGAPTTYPSPLRTPATADGADGEDIKFPEDLDETMEEGSDTEMEEAYVEPWNYEAGHYPTVLPLRKPYSGDPEILNKAEFGEAAMNKGHNEKETNHAKKLHLLEACAEQPKLLFFQLPHSVPLSRQQVISNKGKEVIKISDSIDKKGTATPDPAAAAIPQPQGPQMSATWRDLPSGHVGKLLVYKSGKVKLKMGETLFDVTPGSEGDACEDVVAVNPKSKQFCRLGKVDRHAVVSPDVKSILNDRK